MVRADEEALLHGERLLKLYAEEAKEKEYQQASAIVEDLKRRQKKGTFDKTPAEKWPDGFDKWEVAKKVAYLLDALDEVDARQGGQPGGVDLASDRRVEALIAIGDRSRNELLRVPFVPIRGPESLPSRISRDEFGALRVREERHVGKHFICILLRAGEDCVNSCRRNRRCLRTGRQIDERSIGRRALGDLSR